MTSIHGQLGPHTSRSMDAEKVPVHLKSKLFGWTVVPASHGQEVRGTYVDTLPKESVGAPDQMTVSLHNKSAGWHPCPLKYLPHPVRSVPSV